MSVFSELVYNGLWGCTAVVGANSQKWGHFGLVRARLCALLIGWWYQPVPPGEYPVPLAY